MMRHPISSDLVRELQISLEEAIVRVEGGALKASSSLALTVCRDGKTGEIVVKYALKGGEARTGGWVAAPSAQEELDLEEEEDPEGPRGPQSAANLREVFAISSDDEEAEEGQPPSGRITGPIYRRLGQATRHRMRLAASGTGSPLCGTDTGQEGSAYERVPEHSGAACRDCERLFEQLPTPDAALVG